MSKSTRGLTSNFIQSLPDGQDESNIGKLLAWVSKSVVEMNDARVTNVVLKNVNIPDEKPALAVYYDTSNKKLESEYKPLVLTIMLEKGKDQDNLPLLLEELQKQLAALKPEEVFDIVLDNEINELGNHYRLTVFYDE